MPSGTLDPLVEPRKKYKICLAGEAAVGKTSLIRRFVVDEFEDRYITTLGAKVTKHVLELEMPDTGEADQVVLMIWDIMGQQGIRELLRDAYFFGVQGALMVCDVTRRETLDRLHTWQEAIEQTAGTVASVVLANKVDREDEAEVTRKEVEAFCKERNWPFLMTSAKTGENVEGAFRGLAQHVLASPPTGRS